jgi:phosphatidate cytidylyltransferase
MLERVAYGTLSIAILLGLFLLDAVIASHAEDLTGPVGELLRRGSVIPIAILVVILLGAVELSHLLRMKGARPFTLFGYIVIAVLVLTPWLSAAGWLGSGAVQVEGIYWQAVWLMTACGGVGLAVIIRRDPAGFLRDAGTTLLVIVYLGFLGSFGLQLRCGRDMPEQTGVWLLLMVILITKASDIGAYFAGSLFGRHKLVPTISPAKTIEGAIGGLLTFRAAVFGFIVSLSGQLGDIVESSFKRDACVKDSGKLIPRFGGILDLIDSPMLAVPVAWFLMTAVWRIV